MSSTAPHEQNRVIADLILQQKVLAKQMHDVRKDLRDLARAVRYLTETQNAASTGALPAAAPAGQNAFDQFKEMLKDWDAPEVKWDAPETR